jgi:hypothetical protein
MQNVLERYGPPSHPTLRKYEKRKTPPEMIRLVWATSSKSPTNPLPPFILNTPLVRNRSFLLGISTHLGPCNWVFDMNGWWYYFRLVKHKRIHQRVGDPISLAEKTTNFGWLPPQKHHWILRSLTEVHDFWWLVSRFLLVNRYTLTPLFNLLCTM